MRAFLVFTIQAPLASWGDIAVGEWRGSWDRPSRSAVLGVLGAALGIQRNDRDGQSALRDGYRLAVRADNVGTVMQDYHTMQSIPQNLVKKHALRTRAALWTLDKEVRETILSRREYRQNSLYTVTIWAVGAPRWSLQELAEALLRPVYALYAGRRSNPVGLPLRPEVVEANTLADVFQNRTTLPADLRDMLRALKPVKGWGDEVAHDSCETFDSGLEESHQTHSVRRDVPLDREGWLFADRLVTVARLPRAMEER